MSKRLVFPVAFGSGYAAAHLMGFSPMIAVQWGAVAMAFSGATWLVTRDRLVLAEGAGATSEGGVSMQVRLPPAHAFSPWVYLGMVLVGAVLVSLLTIVFWAEPRHRGARFDQFTVADGTFSLRFRIPAGARSNETVVVSVLLQRFLGAPPLPTKAPSLSEASCAVDHPIQQAVFDPDAVSGVEYSWGVRGSPGMCQFSFLEYGTALFAGTPRVEAVSIPNGGPVQSNVMLLSNGTRARMEVFTTLGLTEYAAKLATAIGAVLGWVVTFGVSCLEGARVSRGNGTEL